MLPIVNLEAARFECTFGRGCDGVCCRNGRPPVDADEIARIEAQRETYWPLLRPEAQKVIDRDGIVSRRRRFGLPLLRVIGGWCVFFHRGCVLHQLGAREGDPYRYKPSDCSLFPLERDARGRWYVRQKGYHGEKWDLPCLDPASSDVRAADSLRDEIALAERIERGL